MATGPDTQGARPEPRPSPLGGSPEWEPWEARRTALPRRTDPDVRQARANAQLLLMVVRTRLAQGSVPFEHAEALAAAALDEHLTLRLRLRAAEALARLREAGMRRLPRTGA